MNTVTDTHTTDFETLVPLTPKEIGELRFNIPLYQRLFEWEDVQITTLLSDLKEHMVTSPDSYFIGMMTGNKNDDVIDLVDGQQRFTAMMLIAVVLRNYAPEWKNFATKERLNFSARECDKTYLDSLIDPESVKCEMPNPKMEHGKKVIEAFLEANDIDKAAFAKWIYKHLTFFVYTLPDVYHNDPRKLNKYFEAMNSAGRSLEQHEKVKVELLKRADCKIDKALLNSIWNIAEKLDATIFDLSESREADELIATLKTHGLKRESVESLLKKSTDNENTLAIEDIVASTQEPKTSSVDNNGSSAVVNFQELLLLALNITLGENKSLDKTKLEARFEKELSSDKIEDFYRNLLLIRLLIDRFVVRISKDGNRNRYALHLDSDEKNEKMMLKQYQAMLYVSEEPHRWLFDFLNWLMEQDGTPSAKSMLVRLKEQDNDEHPKSSLPEEIRYDGSHEIYWFQRLDYYLWENWLLKNDKDKFGDEYNEALKTFTFSANRSVEHFHPQNESNTTTWENTDENGKAPVHSLGNLALISTGFNSEQSNDNEIVKKGRIEQHIKENRVQSLKLLLMYDIYKKNNWNWTEELVKGHGKEMMEILRTSYPD